MMDQSTSSPSPRWNAITKLVFALTVVVLAGALLVRFHTIIGPVLMAFIVAYLLHPIVAFLDRRTPLPWRVIVNVIYLIFLVLLVSLLTWSGFNLIDQVQSLIAAIQYNTNNLPAIVASLSEQVYRVGPFTLDLSRVDWGPLTQQVLSYIQPALGQMGNLVGALAGSAVSTLGWTAFIVIISYFFLLESGGLRERIIQIKFPTYVEDMRRLSRELGLIWNAFLRGQMIIFFFTVLVYSTLWTVLGVRYSIGLGLLVGFANFLPYIGPMIAWITIGLVTFFQGSNPFGITPLAYMALIIGVAIIIDQIFNNLVAPRIMARALRVHPAAVLIAAIIAANLFGILGVIIAGPLLATLNLIGQYSLRKMLDQEPWPEGERIYSPPLAPWLFRRIKKWRQAWQAKRQSKRKAGVSAAKPRKPVDRQGKK